MERFWSKVDIKGPDECWPWTSNTHRQGYGFFKYATKKNRLAHRVAYELTHGVALVPAQKVLHQCDNPCCVNPAHLMLGTQLDNVRDMVAKGRINRLRKLTVEQVLAIRSDPRPNAEISRETGVHNSDVSRIKRGLIHKHVVAPFQGSSPVLPRSL